MKTNTPYRKLSKKQRRALDRRNRNDWGAINPVTRRPERSDAYDRTRENRRWHADAQKGPADQGGSFLPFCA